MPDPPKPDDAALAARLRAGDEGAFRALVKEQHSALTRVARAFVGSEAAAEEVAQDTWMAVIAGLDQFEGRSTLRTWIGRILVNRAKTRAVRDRRAVPFSSLPALSAEDEAPVEPERFLAIGFWRLPPHRKAYRRQLDQTVAIVGELARAEIPPDTEDKLAAAFRARARPSGDR